MADDRFRKHMRVNMPLVIEVKYEGEEDFRPCLTSDISWGGLYIRSEDPKPLGTRLMIQLPSQDGKGTVEIPARVVTRNKFVEGRTLPGEGISFEKTDQDTKGIIQQLVDRMLTSRLK